MSDVYLPSLISTSKRYGNGILTEEEAQELVDHMTMKFRMVKFARIPSYNQFFSGDPVWATLEVGGMGQDGRSYGNKDMFPFPSYIGKHGTISGTEPDCIYSERHLPKNLRTMHLIFLLKQVLSSMKMMMQCVRYGAMTILSAAAYPQHRQEKKCSFLEQEQTLQNASFTRSTVVSMRKTKIQVGPEYRPITSEYLDYDEVMAKYDKMMDMARWTVCKTLNLIQYMHDKYYYEATQMALIDTNVRRTFATGIAGFSHVVDSPCAIKYAKVKQSVTKTDSL